MSVMVACTFNHSTQETGLCGLEASMVYRVAPFQASLGDVALRLVKQGYPKSHCGIYVCFSMYLFLF